MNRLMACSHPLPYCSWEPHENVESCQRLLESFWSHIGTDDNDYFPGYVVSASEGWIGEQLLSWNVRTG